MDKIKYLGMNISENRKHQKYNKDLKLNLARKIAGMAYSVVARSCNKMMIGKIYWKSILLPCILTENPVLIWTKEELERLQRIENGVWRQVLGTPSYVAVETELEEEICGGN